MLARLSQRASVAEDRLPPPLPPRGLSPEDQALCEATADADTAFVESCRRVFDAIDADRGGSLSSAELRDALERLSVRAATGEGASAADADAMVSAADADNDGAVDFGEFVKIVLTGGAGAGGGSGWWARFLRILRGSDVSDDHPELVRLETEEDVEKLIARFTTAFRGALDELFDRLATAPDVPGSLPSPGEGTSVEEHVISEASALAWLELVNRELGRGGTYRSVMAAFEQSSSGRDELTRHAWYSIFARELSEGKWWQVAYDLDVSGVALEDFDLDAGDVATYVATAQQQPGNEGAAGAVQDAPRSVRAPRRHYEAWLDYVYYSSEGLRLVAYQESLTEQQAQLIYKDGDALPNAWHPSDHLPVGCVFELV